MTIDVLKRYAAIIGYLKPGRYISKAEMLHRLKLNASLHDNGETRTGVSSRNLDRDFRYIRNNFGFDIVYSHKHCGYHGVPNNFDDADMQRLLDSLQLLSFKELAGKHAAAYLPEQRNASGMEYIPELLKAINNRKQVQFTHTKYWDPIPCVKQVAPLAVKQSQGLWYLVGDDNGSLRCYGLDRVSALNTLNISIGPVPERDLEAYFKDCFGVMGQWGQAPERVVIVTSNLQGHYLKALPLHPSQQVIHEDENRMTLAFDVHITHDFRMALLSMGSNVKVEEPATLAAQMAEELRAALAAYD